MIRKQKIILGIIGSPRQGGNTEIIVGEVLTGAEQAGALSEKVFLNELNIIPCQGCDACRTKGVCIQKDDYKKVLKRMEQSDIWVMGTPVYYWGPSAQFKAFMDRWYGVDQKLFKKRKVIAVIPLGDGNISSARHTEGMLKGALRWQGVNLIEIIVAPGIFEKGKVKHHPEILKKARLAGLNAVNY
jgi:multimeric flavodoxin WrbA